MSEIPKRTKARAEFALGILVRHRRNLDAAIDALRAVEQEWPGHRSELRR